MTCTPLDDFEFKINHNEIELIKYKSDCSTIIIPEQYSISSKKYKVSRLHHYCFENCLMDTITISGFIKEIPIGCFENCKSLKEVKVPNSIQIINKYAFSNCINLECITLPNNLETIEIYAFYGCENLKNIKINKTLKTIKSFAFRNCNNLVLNAFENQYIKIKNNNIYQKERLFNNKILYHLTNCHQKNNTLMINKNEIIVDIKENTKAIIDYNKKINSFVLEKNVQTLIYPKAEEIMDILNKKEEKEVKNIYITNQLKNIFRIEPKVKNIYFNGSKKEFENIKKRIKYNKIIYKKDINELLEEGYSFKQINLIIKGYKNGILLSNINKDISENILRNIINNFNYDNIKLYDILEILQKENITLEDQIEIQDSIKDKIKENDITIEEIEK